MKSVGKQQLLSSVVPCPVLPERGRPNFGEGDMWDASAMCRRCVGDVMAFDGVVRCAGDAVGVWRCVGCLAMCWLLGDVQSVSRILYTSYRQDRDTP